MKRRNPPWRRRPPGTARLDACMSTRHAAPLAAADRGVRRFEPAYLMGSWLCWMPNVVVAGLYLRSSRAKDPLAFLALRNA